MRKRMLASNVVLVMLLTGCADPVASPPDAAAADPGPAHTHAPTGPFADPAGGGGGQGVPQNAVYAAIRAATAEFQQIDRAIEAGYVRGSDCVVSPAGGMGYHYIRPDLIDGVLEPTRPEALLYEPQENGRLRLVAVEHIVVAGLWDGDGPPMLGSQPFDDHTAPGSPGPPFPHYQLHSWVWKHNPAGMHTPYNPTVGCDHADAG